MTTITTERKEELAAKGYFIEDMGSQWGSEWVGQFRFMNSKTNDFQDYETSCSTEEAWFEADLRDLYLQTDDGKASVLSI